MKTFLYSIPNRIHSFSKKVDVKSALCGKSWVVFNDEGIKQLFIFKTDGTLIITNNGKVFNASWNFISQNSSILISTGEETIMFRTAFFDKVLFVIRQDGIERYLFMIDENKVSLFPNISLESLTAYIDRELMEVALAEKQKQLQKEMTQEEQEREKVQQQLLKEEEREAIVEYIKEHKEEMRHKLSVRKKIVVINFAIIFIFIILALCIDTTTFFNFVFCITILVTVAVIGILGGSTPLSIIGHNLQNGVQYHSDDDVQKIYEEL